MLDVVICGAGPVGMMMSMLLSRENISHVLIEKRPQVSVLPRARGIMSRTVEIWAQFGLYDELTSFSLPPEWNNQFLYFDRLAGDVIGFMPSNCMPPGSVERFTPYEFRCAAQDRIDAMLWRKAAELPQADLRFSTELLDFEQRDDHVVLKLRNADGVEEELEARWLIAADGGRSQLREQAGITSTGPTNLGAYLNTYFEADLGAWTKDRKGTLIWALDRRCAGTFQALDGDKRWMCQILLDPDGAPIGDWTEDQVLRRLRDMIGDPAAEELPIKLHSFYGYHLAACVADRLRVGRLLLVGDAAHRIPPAGGSGMNTGVQTAHNLAWKLAAVLRGEAGEGLLDSYAQERRQAAFRACDYGRVNAGFIHDMVVTPSVEEKKALIARSRQFGNWSGLDLGVHYKGEGAFIPDGSPPPSIDDSVIDYIPTAKPGYRAPHIWLRRGAERVTTIDLLQGGFTLLVGPDGEPWARASKARSKPKVACLRIGAHGEWEAEGDFLSLYGIAADGAVLVRPDGHVAYRSHGGVADPDATLAKVMQTILVQADVVALPA